MSEFGSKLTGLILAGGESRRMGRDKAILKVGGRPLINHVINAIEPVCDPIYVVSSPDRRYEFLDKTVIVDIEPGLGAIMGLYTGLLESPTGSALVLACDMPFIKTALVRYMAKLAPMADVVVPRFNGYLEPLFATYSKRCIPAIEQMLKRGQKRIYDFFSDVKVREVTEEDIRHFDPEFTSFHNLNTPEDLLAFSVKDMPLKDMSLENRIA